MGDATPNQWYSDRRDRSLIWSPQFTAAARRVSILYFSLTVVRSSAISLSEREAPRGDGGQR